MDLVSNQTIGGSKTFTEEILGTAQNCSRTITAGEGLKGGGQLLSDITLNVDTGNGLGIDSDNLVALAGDDTIIVDAAGICLLYTSPSPRDATLSRMPSSA